MASATDISTGGRLTFTQSISNLLCSALAAVTLSRAAVASSAVPVVFSTVTLNNHGGTCNYEIPAWVEMFTQFDNPPSPAARAIRELRDGEAYTDSFGRPYIHVVDGEVSDNVVLRGMLDALQLFETLRIARLPTPLDHVKRIVVLIINSLSSPPTNWDASEQGPGPADVLIAHYSYEAVELLKDISARWATARHLRELAECSTQTDSPVCAAIRVPKAELYAIDVSFAALKDKAEFDCLNQQPTSFVLPAESVDRLRAAAGTIIAASPEFQDAGAKVVTLPVVAASATAP